MLTIGGLAGDGKRQLCVVQRRFGTVATQSELSAADSMMMISISAIGQCYWHPLLNGTGTTGRRQNSELLQLYLLGISLN